MIKRVKYKKNGNLLESTTKIETLSGDTLKVVIDTTNWSARVLGGNGIALAEIQAYVKAFY